MISRGSMVGVEVVVVGSVGVGSAGLLIIVAVGLVLAEVSSDSSSKLYHFYHSEEGC